MFIIYINDIYNSTSVGKFVLFADDTNIFVADKCKLKVFEKANRILESINSYMRCNLLHINIKKCCYMHFTPKKKYIVVDDDNAINIVLGQNNIKLVREIKILGVIIDDKLSWKPHTKYLNSKLKCEIGKLNMMKHVIPSELYKNVYLTLFESHLSYGITAWGGISNNLLQPLFITQKKCIRVMFGDKDAYMDKFKTCARTRSFENRFLGKDFFQGEPSKSLFHSNNLLTIHNLYKYHCIVELFKLIKLRTPMSIYELMKHSERRENYFISLPPSSLFDYQASNFWNKCHKSNSEIDFTTSIKIVKTKLKICLVWHEFNFDTDHFSF